MQNNQESIGAAEKQKQKKSRFYIPPKEDITEQEINSVLLLQNKYLRTGDVEKDKQEGRYLSTITNSDSLNEMLQENGLVLVLDSNTNDLAGYALLSSFSTAENIPAQKVFLEKMKDTTYHGESLSKKDIIIYHQICLDEEYRNSRVPLELAKEIRKRFFPKYKYVIGKIGDDNPKSLNLTLDHLGFEYFSQYSENGRSLSIVLQDFNAEKVKVERQYERYARAYNLLTGIFPPYQELKSAHVGSAINNTQEGEWVLDFGAGTGNVTFDLLKNNRNVVALDINDGMLNFCRQKLVQFKEDRFKIVSKGIFDVNFEEGVFGSVSALNVLYHLKTGEHEMYLSEFFRILRSGGVVSFSGPHSDTTALKLRDFILKHISKEDQVRYREQLDIAINTQKTLVEDPDRKNISGDELVRIMQEVGFSEIEKDDSYYDGLNYFIKARKI